MTNIPNDWNIGCWCHSPHSHHIHQTSAQRSWGWNPPWPLGLNREPQATSPHSNYQVLGWLFQNRMHWHGSFKVWHSTTGSRWLCCHNEPVQYEQASSCARSCCTTLASFDARLKSSCSLTCSLRSLIWKLAIWLGNDLFLPFIVVRSSIKNSVPLPAELLVKSQ